MKFKLKHFSNLQIILVIVLFLFSSIQVNASVDTKTALYSIPTSITASMSKNIVKISAKPEIWNPSNSITSSSVEFQIKFDLTIKNNSLNLDYETTIMKTLIGFTEIPSGLTTQNTFTATYNFSSTLEKDFNGTNLFNATIDIQTIAPESITSNYNHVSINGSRIHIKNNSTLIQLASPLDDWGSTRTVPGFDPPIAFILVGMGIISLKKKK